MYEYTRRLCAYCGCDWFGSSAFNDVFSIRSHLLTRVCPQQKYEYVKRTSNQRVTRSQRARRTISSLVHTELQMAYEWGHVLKSAKVDTERGSVS